MHLVQLLPVFSWVHVALLFLCLCMCYFSYFIFFVMCVCFPCLFCILCMYYFGFFRFFVVYIYLFSMSGLCLWLTFFLIFAWILVSLITLGQWNKTDETFHISCIILAKMTGVISIFNCSNFIKHLSDNQKIHFHFPNFMKKRKLRTLWLHIFLWNPDSLKCLKF